MKSVLTVFLLCLFSLFACDSLESREVVSVSIQLRPSFAEEAFFKLAANSKSIRLDQSWRIVDTPAVMYEMQKAEQVDLSDYNFGLNLGIDSNYFESKCDVLDGLRFIGTIELRSGDRFRFNLTDCKYDTLAHELSKQILFKLKYDFKEDSIARDYLWEISRSYLDVKMEPMDSLRYLNGPLMKLRKELIEKIYSDKVPTKKNEGS
ncbi:hypothetical protein [Croceimicrobium sp.]|uniref:hypothetical protein n=1 Tax=Croceimicrobium sp. TaxID=2828340 RepID=UPI003BAA9D45